LCSGARVRLDDVGRGAFVKFLDLALRAHFVRVLRVRYEPVDEQDDGNPGEERQHGHPVAHSLAQVGGQFGAGLVQDLREREPVATDRKRKFVLVARNASALPMPVESPANVVSSTAIQMFAGGMSGIQQQYQK